MAASSRHSAQFAQLCATVLTDREALPNSHVRHCTLHCFQPQPISTQFLTPEYKVPNMAGSLDLTPSTAHQIFCPRPFAKNGGVHVTWQTLLSGCTRTVATADKGQLNASIFVQRFSGCCRPTILYRHSCKLCLLRCQKAAIGTNPVTPAEH